MNWNQFVDSEVNAAQYIENKRPVYPVKYNKSNYDEVHNTFDNTSREIIELSSDDEEDPEEMVNVFISNEITSV